MRTISCKLEDLKTMTLHIGYESENDYTSVRIDAGSVFAEYPQAVPSLKVQPPKGSTYPVNVTRDGTVVIWNVKESDTANNGNGEGQLTFTDGEVVKKCQPFKIIVHRSLKGNGTAPDPVQDWIEEASGIVEAAEEAAQNAEAAAAHAPIIGLDGYWYRWDAEAEEYVSTGTQAQGPEGEPGQPGEPGDPTELIDDTDPAANKTFSSSKIDTELTNVKSGIDGKLDSSAIDNTGITNKTYTVIKDAIITTVDDGEHENPYATISGGSIDSQYVYRVTFDGTVYICHVGGWYEMVSGELKGYECLGDINLYNSSITGLIYNENDKPFCIIYNNAVFDGFQIFTPDAGNHSVKIERINYTKENIPNTLLWGRDNSPVRFFKYRNSSYLCINILGMNTFANRGEIAIGSANELSGEFARIFGHGNKASGNQATAIGSGNNAAGRNAVVIGFKNEATAESATAIGNQCKASGVAAASIGDQNEASGDASFATGYKSKASGYASCADGGGTEASGYFAKTTGYKTKASGSCSSAHGQETIANHNAQFVFGKYNVADPSTAAATNDGNFVEIGGIGTGTNARKNCRAVDFNGNHFIKGDMYVKCNDDSTGGTKLEPVIVEEVTGSTPSITGEANHRYICGECSTLSIVAPASGIIDVLFESGSTATVLTVTSAKQGVSAIKWANGFDPANLDANRVYELNIMNGEYGVVCEWT